MFSSRFTDKFALWTNRNENKYQASCFLFCCWMVILMRWHQFHKLLVSFSTNYILRSTQCLTAHFHFYILLFFMAQSGHSHAHTYIYVRSLWLKIFPKNFYLSAQWIAALPASAFIFTKVISATNTTMRQMNFRGKYGTELSLNIWLCSLLLLPQ